MLPVVQKLNIYYFGNISKRIIKKNILRFCGIETRVYHIYKTNSSNESKVYKIIFNKEKDFDFLGL